MGFYNTGNVLLDYTLLSSWVTLCSLPADYSSLPEFELAVVELLASCRILFFGHILICPSRLYQRTSTWKIWNKESGTNKSKHWLNIVTTFRQQQLAGQKLWLIICLSLLIIASYSYLSKRIHMNNYQSFILS